MNILVYGDSMSWGIIPGSRQRQIFSKRWPGVMKLELGDDCHLIEECLNGRTTAYEDPNRPNRHGIDHVQMVLESNSPIDLFILMLGVNDFQDCIGATALESAENLGKLIERIRSICPEPMSSPPQILCVIQPEIQQAKGPMAEKFSGSSERGKGSEDAYKAILKKLDVPYFLASEHVDLSQVDGVHLDGEEHRILGEKLAEYIRS